MRLLLIAVLLAGVLLACGPVASPPIPSDHAIPLAQSGEAEPDPTETPEPTKAPVSPKPTKVPEPTKPPETDDIAEPVDEPEPEPVYDAQHPDGFAGCANVRLLAGDESHQYQEWCSEQLADHVETTCGSHATSAEQQKCGRDIAKEYGSLMFRHGYIGCAGVADRGDRDKCVMQQTGDLDKVFNDVWEAWEKVRVVGDRDAGVQKARAQTLKCVEGKGFKNPNPDLLFDWQRMDSPSEWLKRGERLSWEDRKLREELVEPSVTCGKQEGMFAEQDRAWAAELRRLDKEEPALAAPLIREGFLDALDKPGVSPYLLPDPDDAN